MTDATIGGTRRAYLPELDGLRTLAFLLVFGFHGGLPWVSEALSLVTLPLFVLTLPFGPTAGGWVADIGPGVARALRSNGWVGVQLFFVLSGYLIATLLLREEAAFGRVDLRAFWARRVLRIWPLYYLTVAVTFFLLPALDGRLSTPGHRAMLAGHLPAFLAFGGNWSMIARGPVGDDAVSILWSVCVEEQFYVVCPFLFVLVKRPRRLAIVAALMAAAVGVRAWLASGRPDQFMIQYNAFAQMDTMLSGVALAIVLDRRQPSGEAPRGWGWPVLGLVLFTLFRPELAHARPARQVWDFVLVWVACVGVVATPILFDGRFRRWLADPRLVWLGRISFGLYMWHEVALWAVRHASGWAWAKELPLSLIALGMTIGLAAASYYGMERPFLRLKRRWTRVPSRPV